LGQWHQLLLSMECRSKCSALTCMPIRALQAPRLECLQAVHCQIRAGCDWHVQAIHAACQGSISARADTLCRHSQQQRYLCASGSHCSAVGRRGPPSPPRQYWTASARPAVLCNSSKWQNRHGWQVNAALAIATKQCILFIHVGCTLACMPHPNGGSGPQ